MWMGYSKRVKSNIVENYQDLNEVICIKEPPSTNNLCPNTSDTLSDECYYFNPGQKCHKSVTNQDKLQKYV